MKPSKGFTKIPNSLIEEMIENENLKLSDVKVLLYILRVTMGWNREKKDISYNEISKKLKINNRTVKVSIKRLIDDGFISCEREKYSNKSYDKNIYSINGIFDQGGGSGPQTTRGSGPQTTRVVVHRPPPQKIEKNPKVKAVSEKSGIFDQGGGSDPQTTTILKKKDKEIKDKERRAPQNFPSFEKREKNLKNTVFEKTGFSVSQDRLKNLASLYGIDKVEAAVERISEYWRVVDSESLTQWIYGRNWETMEANFNIFLSDSSFSAKIKNIRSAKTKESSGIDWFGKGG